MSMLITDAEKGVFLLRDQSCALPIPCMAESPCQPTNCGKRLSLLNEKSRTCHILTKKDFRQELEFPAPPGACSFCPSPCGRWLYILGADADAVHTVHLGNGELTYAAPAGVFSRSMRLSPSGNHLLVAGGAENRAYLLSAPELFPEETIRTRHPCFSADFWQNGLVLVCAAGGEDIQTVIYTLAPGKLRPRELLRLPGLPGALSVCPDGLSALISTPDGLIRLSLLTGELLWNLPEAALCMALSIQKNQLLISDLPGGQVILLPLHQPHPRRVLWQGENTHACFI